MTKKSSCVLVLGSNRAGTSVLARSLVAVGFELGNRLIPPRPDNPKGFFEDAVAEQANDEFLRASGTAYDGLVAPKPSPEVIANFQSQIRRGVLKEFCEKPRWALKDPRLSRLWHYWLPLLVEEEIETTFILANRHPISVAKSLAKRNGMPTALGLALWATYQIDGVEALAQHGGLVVDYDLLVNNPHAQIHRIAIFLRVSENLIQEKVDDFINSFLEKNLRHSYDVDVAQDEPDTALTELCLDLYRFLNNLALRPNGVEPFYESTLLGQIQEFRQRILKFNDFFAAIHVIWLQNEKLGEQLSKLEATEVSTIQLYWSFEQGGKPTPYSEQCSAFASYRINGARQTIELTFPDGIFGPVSLRLDPSNQPVAVTLHKLSVISPQREFIWVWDESESAFQGGYDIVLRSTHKGLQIICLSHDPWFDLSIPQQKLACIRGGEHLMLEITAHSFNDVFGEILRWDEELIANLRGSARGISNTSSSVSSVELTACVPSISKSLEEVVYLLESGLARRDQVIGEKSFKIRAMRDELLRAEVQLALLKDVMLGGRHEDRL